MIFCKMEVQKIGDSLALLAFKTDLIYDSEMVVFELSFTTRKLLTELSGTDVFSECFMSGNAHRNTPDFAGMNFIGESCFCELPG